MDSNPSTQDYESNALPPDHTGLVTTRPHWSGKFRKNPFAVSGNQITGGEAGSDGITRPRVLVVDALATIDKGGTRGTRETADEVGGRIRREDNGKSRSGEATKIKRVDDR